MKNRLFLIISIACIFLVWVALHFYQTPNRENDQGPHKIRVVSTLFPLFDMAKNIGAEEVEVSLLLPPGVEAHTFEPKPSDFVKINEADVFIYTGRFMEPWAEQIIKGVTNKKLIIVDASQDTKMIRGVLPNTTNQAGSLDPHIWLDFDNAKIMVRNISRALKVENPSQRDFFEKNAEKYNNKLIQLDSTYKAVFATCKSKEIVYGGHYAFGYLANHYDLKYCAAQGFIPDAEPTAEDLARLIEQIREGNIKYIFYGELANPRIAETISHETNTKMLLLNAAHNLTRGQLDSGVSFIDILNNNLNNLSIGLECRQ